MTAAARGPAGRGPEGRGAAIEQATLIKIARDAAQQRMAARPSLVSAYLTGSVAANEPMLGEATDIDLVLIDASPPASPREVVRLTDQVVLDIHYRARADYANPKTLRVHPWLGPELAEPIFLHDPTHFFELSQASARGQFYRQEFVAARARTFLAWARAALHIGLLPGAEPEAPVSLGALCQALLFAANAGISLAAFPGAGRRLVMKLEAAAGKLRRADLYDEFLALLGGGRVPADRAEALLAGWQTAYRAGQSATDELIHPARRTIYERGFRALIQADRAAEAQWLMLATWNACMQNVPRDSAIADSWADFLGRLGLADPDGFHDRVQQAVDYVTLVDGVVEGWAESNGA
jgi:hypothetical protein